MQLWEVIKKAAGNGYSISIDPGCRVDNCLSLDSVVIRLSDIRSLKRMSMNVELKHGVSDDGKVIYYDPDEAIKNAIAYMLYKMEKEVKK